MNQLSSFISALRRWITAPARPEPIPRGVRADVEGYLAERRGQLSHWFFLMRAGLMLGLAGYLSIDAFVSSAPWPPYLGLLLGYGAANAAVRYAAPRCACIAPWAYGFIDLAFFLLLRHVYALEMFIDPNATLVGFLALVLISYTLYGNPTLSAGLALASMMAAGASIYFDPHPSGAPEWAAYADHPFRVFLLIEYLSIACLVTCLVALRLRRQVVGYCLEMYRRMQAAVDSAAERARREQVVDLDRLKRNFISLLSHELRGPIMPLCSSLEVVQEEMEAGRLDREMLDVARESAGTLQRLISDYVQLADLLTKHDAGAPHWNIPLAPFIDTLLNTTTQRARYIVAGLEDRTAAGDPFLLRGALTAIFRRAELCTPEGERITITAREEDEAVVLTVHDPASHLQPQDAESLDDVFSPLSERVFFSANTGLELVLAQHALRRAGARLRVHSAEGEGTTIACVLPPAREDLKPLSIDQFHAIPA